LFRIVSRYRCHLFEINFFNFFFSADGNVYTWGTGTKNSLGIADATTSSNYYTPQKIVSTTNSVSSVGCGDAHTVLFSDQLNIKAFGDKNYFAGGKPEMNY
jgi:alpha-tubulin suppressor-like RCC1 family protein